MSTQVKFYGRTGNRCRLIGVVGRGVGSIRLELAYLSAWFNAKVHSCDIGVSTARGGKGSAILTLSDAQVSKSLAAYQLQCRCFC